MLIIIIIIILLLSIVQQKLQNRKKALQKNNFAWSKSRIEHVNYMLQQGIAYMSSEESGSDEDDVTLQRKPLPWLKTKYRTCLRKLDALHYKSLSQKSKTMCRKRVEGIQSTRCQPDNCPAYLIGAACLPA